VLSILTANGFKLEKIEARAAAKQALPKGQATEKACRDDLAKNRKLREVDHLEAMAMTGSHYARAWPGFNQVWLAVPPDAASLRSFRRRPFPGAEWPREIAAAGQGQRRGRGCRR
jgi:hypothetical protein